MNPGALRRWLRSAPDPATCHVSDRASWVLDWVARSIAAALNEQGLPAALTADPWALRRRLIHFHDRYRYFNGPPERLHSSNRVFLTWFHGDPADPLMVPVFEQLHAALPRLERIVVSCSATREHAGAAGIPAEVMTQIPLGVDLDLFAPPAPGERAAIRARPRASARRAPTVGGARHRRRT